MFRSLLALLIACAFLAACSPGEPIEPDAGENRPDGGETDGGDEEPQCVQSFAHGVGYPCNRTADCVSGFCFEDLFDSFCTVECDPSGAEICPENFECAAGEAGGPAFVCRPADFGLPLPGDRTLPAGSPCNHDGDCEGDFTICEAVPLGDGNYYRYCAVPCEEASECGECGSCVPSRTRETRCVPRGAGAIGATCEVPHDCVSFDCRGFCTAPCDPGDADPCPLGGSCVEAGQGEHLCVSADRLGELKESEACLFHFQCPADHRCREGGSGRVCMPAKDVGERCFNVGECREGLRCRPATPGAMETCELPGEAGDTCRPASNGDCGGGLECRRLSAVDDVCSGPCADDEACGEGNRCVAIDLDTEIHLFDHPNGNPRATNPGSVARGTNIDRIAGNEWSEISGFSITTEAFPRTSFPAAFYVTVHSPSGSVGSYRLEILAGEGEPEVVAEAEGQGAHTNDAGAAAESVPFPAVVEGFLSTGDVDVFVFEVDAPVTVTLRTTRGAPSTCLPETLAGATGFAERCSMNLQCASGFCEGRLQSCVEPCPEGQEQCSVDSAICAQLTDGAFCVLPEFEGKPLGTPCAYDYECDSERCLLFEGQRVCSGRCDAGQTCPTGMECHEGDCVPNGNRSGAFHATCVRQTDCRPDLACVSGRCTTACEDDAACPAQAFPVEAQVACLPCLKHDDCGFSGRCVQRDSESFCAPPCTGGCGEGFVCSVAEGSVCVPEHGSCRRPVCLPEEVGSFCRVPSGDYAEACLAPSDCTTGACADGLCSRECSDVADCGCEPGDMICDAGACVPDPARVREVEPNDRPAQAQVVPALPFTVLAELRPVAAVPDRDYYAITLDQGDRVTVRTRPVCATAAPGFETRVMLWYQGRVVAQDDYRDRYGKLTHLVFNAGEYIVEVRDDSFGDPQTGAYVLEIER